MQTWHQQRALNRAHALRNTPAHILRSDHLFTGKALCGVKSPAVRILADQRDNPDNKCCLSCKRIADTL
jgi:hypothetical protein